LTWELLAAYDLYYLTNQDQGETMNALDLLQTVAIISSILLGAWQVRAHTAQIRSAQFQSFTSSFNELNLLGFSDPGYFQELSNNFDPKTGPTERPYYFLGLAISKFEDVFEQYKIFGTISKEIWEAQAPLLLLYLDIPDGRRWWDNAVGGDIDTVNDEFTLYIDAMLKGNK